MLRLSVVLLSLVFASAQGQRGRPNFGTIRTFDHFPAHNTQNNDHFNSQFNFRQFDREAKFVSQQQHPRQQHHQHIDREEPEVPQEFEDAHKAFSLDVLKHQYYAQTVEKFGAVSVSPFSFGHFLALVNERTFNLNTVNIPKVLHLPVGKVAESYSVWAEAHEDDHKTYVTSQLYTQNEHVVLTPGQTRLGLHHQTLAFAEDAPSLINSHVRVATHDHIDDDLVPNVPILDRDTTKGVYVSTLHYHNYWEHEFLPIGKKSFHTPSREVEVETVEVIGTFPVYENPMFQAVALPLESNGEDKHLVLVLPKTTLKHYLTSEAVDYVFKTDPTTWVKKTIRVQVPHVNLTLAHNVEQYITNENIVCNKDQGDQLHPIVQVTNFVINHEEVSYAVSTGAQVTSVKPTRTNFAKSQRTNFFTPQYKFEPVQPRHPKENSLSVNELYFDKPFFTYFYETTYGPFGYTAISHVFTPQTPQVFHHQARHHDNPFDFTEQTKNLRWTCDGQH